MVIKMINKKKFGESLMGAVLTFFICTTCISIAMGILGILFLPDAQFGYEGFFVPSIFGFISAILKMFLSCFQKDNIKSAVITKVVYLMLIEIIIWAINDINSGGMELVISLWVAFAVFIVFLAGSLIIWLFDCEKAKKFNKELIKFQNYEQNKLK